MRRGQRNGPVGTIAGQGERVGAARRQRVLTVADGDDDGAAASAAGIGHDAGDRHTRANLARDNGRVARADPGDGADCNAWGRRVGVLVGHRLLDRSDLVASRVSGGGRGEDGHIATAAAVRDVKTVRKVAVGVRRDGDIGQVKRCVNQHSGVGGQANVAGGNSSARF